MSTPIFVRVRNSIKILTSFYDFYLTRSSKLLPLKYMEITTFTIFHQLRYVGDCLYTSNIHCNFLYIICYNIVIICCQIQNMCQYCLISFLSLQIACKQNHVFKDEEFLYPMVHTEFNITGTNTSIFIITEITVITIMKQNLSMQIL